MKILKKRTRKGLCLSDLLFVIAAIGALAAIAMTRDLRHLWRD
jgi:hypothetical protein